MRKRNLLFIAILIILFVGGIFTHAIYMDAIDWRDRGQRYYCIYQVSVGNLSGREVEGTTVVMVPIPATKEGKLFTPPAQKDPYFTQELMHEINNWPEKHRKGPYFENATEVFDNKTINGNWTTFIAETDKGYMLGFRTNETRLEDISYSVDFVADYFDIFDPINNESPILFPIENISDISVVPYGEYTKYSSNPTYDSYVYVSDNLGEGSVSFYVHLQANNDPNEWSREYRGLYMNEIITNVNATGNLKVSAVLGQVIPHGNYTLWYGRYGPEYYANETLMVRRSSVSGTYSVHDN